VDAKVERTLVGNRDRQVVELGVRRVQLVFTTMALAVNSWWNTVTLFCRLFTFVMSVFTLVWSARDETLTSRFSITIA
jgi:hypothetical protein